MPHRQSRTRIPADARLTVRCKVTFFSSFYVLYTKFRAPVEKSAKCLFAFTPDSDSFTLPIEARYPNGYNPSVQLHLSIFSLPPRQPVETLNGHSQMNVACYDYLKARYLNGCVPTSYTCDVFFLPPLFSSRTLPFVYKIVNTPLSNTPLCIPSEVNNQCQSYYTWRPHIPTDTPSSHLRQSFFFNTSIN